MNIKVKDVVKRNYVITRTMYTMIPVTAVLFIITILAVELVTKTAPYSYIVLAGLFAGAVLILADIYGFKYMDSKNEEVYCENRQRLSKRLFAKVVPSRDFQEKIAKDDLSSYIVEKATVIGYYALLKKKDMVLIILLARLKNGNVIPKSYGVSKRYFDNNFIVADDSAPEEIKLKLQ